MPGLKEWLAREALPRRGSNRENSGINGRPSCNSKIERGDSGRAASRRKATPGGMRRRDGWISRWARGIWSKAQESTLSGGGAKSSTPDVGFSAGPTLVARPAADVDSGRPLAVTAVALKQVRGSVLESWNSKSPRWEGRYLTYRQHEPVCPLLPSRQLPSSHS